MRIGLRVPLQKLNGAHLRPPLYLPYPLTEFHRALGRYLPVLSASAQRQSSSSAQAKFEPRTFAQISKATRFSTVQQFECSNVQSDLNNINRRPLEAALLLDRFFIHRRWQRNSSHRKENAQCIQICQIVALWHMPSNDALAICALCPQSGGRLKTRERR